MNNSNKAHLCYSFYTVISCALFSVIRTCPLAKFLKKSALLTLKNLFCLLREDLDREVIPLLHILIIPTNQSLQILKFG